MNKLEKEFKKIYGKKPSEKELESYKKNRIDERFNWSAWMNKQRSKENLKKLY